MKPQNLRTLLTLFLAGILVFHLLAAWNAREQLRKGYSDFAIFYTAGTILRQGLGQELYDPGTQFRVQRQFAPDVGIRQGPLPYNHPAFEALLYIRLSALPYFAAYLVWVAVSLGILFALPIVLGPYLPILRRAPPWLWWVGALAFFPVFIVLLQGQDSILLLLLFALAYVSLKRNADLTAGCWLALGLFRFHLVLPLVLILALQRKGKAMVGFGLTASVLVVLSVALVGWKTTVSYPAYLWQLESHLAGGAIVPADMPNLRGLLDTFLGARVSPIAMSALFLLLAVTCVLFASAKWKLASASGTFDLAFSLAMVISVLVSYHAYAHDLSLLYLPVLLLANYLQSHARAWGWKDIALVGPPLLLFLSPLEMALQARGQLNLLALVLLLWAGGLVREMARQESTALHRAEPV